MPIDLVDVNQSLQINNIVVVPSQNQVTVHPQTGKKERIFVGLEAIYPTPDQPGTELSFEEIVAANRGWLEHVWDDELVDNSRGLEESGSPLREIEGMNRGMADKLVVDQDRVLYDENGAIMEPPCDSRLSKKKKVMEVNETQISEQLERAVRPVMQESLTNGQSEPSWTRLQGPSFARRTPRSRQ